MIVRTLTAMAIIAFVVVSLAACVAIVGDCELVREPVAWSLSCSPAGSAVVMPPGTLQTIIVEPAASGAKP